MLLLVIAQSYTSVFFNLTLHIIPGVLGLFSNKLVFGRSQEIQYLLVCQCPGRC